MKRHPVPTVGLILLLVFVQACAPKPAGPQPAAAPTATYAAGANPAAPQPSHTAAATPALPTPVPTREPLPRLALAAPQGSAANAAARLAAGLAAAPDALAAYPLVVELLAWSSIPVYDSATAALLVPVVEPAAAVTLFDFQAYGFALDYTNGGGLNLAEVAEALTETGTTLYDLPISSALLADLLSRWVTAARGLQPESWEAFVPLYLAESALRKPHALDLAYPGYSGEDLHYAHLEWLLFFAAQARSGPAPAPSLAAGGRGPGLSSLAAADMCTLYQKALELLGEMMAGELNSMAGDTLGDVIEDTGKDWGGKWETAGKWVGKGLGWFMGLLTFVANSTAWSITVRAEPDPSHYKHNESNDKTAYFYARAKMEEKWPEWLGSCMKSMGMDVPDQNAVKSAKIRWRGLHGFPKHATIDGEGLNGQLESRFNEAGEAKMKVILSQEKNGDWETAPQKDDYIKVKVELLFDAKFPGPSTWLAAAKGGPLGASIPTLTQWAQRWFPEKAYGTMKVQYHKIVPMVFERETTADGITTTVTGYNCQGIYGDWVVETVMSGTSQGMEIKSEGLYTGETTKGESGTFSGSMTIWFKLANSIIPIDGSLETQAKGEMKIAGTEQAPVLQMQANTVSGSGSAKGPDVQVQSPFSGPGGSPIGFLLKESPGDSRCGGE